MGLRMILGSGVEARAHRIVELEVRSAVMETKVELVVWECDITAVGVGGRLPERLGGRYLLWKDRELRCCG